MSKYQTKMPYWLWKKQQIAKIKYNKSGTELKDLITEGKENNGSQTDKYTSFGTKKA